MSKLSFGKFEIDTGFLIVAFVLGVVGYLLYTGILHPIEIYNNAVNWIKKH